MGKNAPGAQPAGQRRRTAVVLAAVVLGSILLVEGRQWQSRQLEQRALDERAEEERDRWTRWAAAETDWQTMQASEALIAEFTPLLAELADGVVALELPRVGQRHLFADPVTVSASGLADRNRRSNDSGGSRSCRSLLSSPSRLAADGLSDPFLGGALQVLES